MSQKEKLFRINRLLSARGYSSRRGSEKVVLEGRVKVNGKIVRELSEKFPEDSIVTVDGKTLNSTAKHLYIFHKPRNVVTTMSDPEGRPSVAEYISDLPVRTFPIGRLDFDVSGLLLLTNDGDLADKLLHPRYEAEREYIARVKGQFRSDDCKRVQRGFEVAGEKYGAKRCETVTENGQSRALLGTREDGESLVSVIVSEGRKHFVKDLFRASGHPVVRLSRVRFGAFVLGRLAPGQIREVEFQDL